MEFRLWSYVFGSWGVHRWLLARYTSSGRLEAYRLASRLQLRRIVSTALPSLLFMLGGGKL